MENTLVHTFNGRDEGLHILLKNRKWVILVCILGTGFKFKRYSSQNLFRVKLCGFKKFVVLFFVKEKMIIFIETRLQYYLNYQVIF